MGAAAKENLKLVDCTQLLAYPIQDRMLSIFKKGLLLKSKGTFIRTARGSTPDPHFHAPIRACNSSPAPLPRVAGSEVIPWVFSRKVELGGSDVFIGGVGASLSNISEI